MPASILIATKQMANERNASSARTLNSSSFCPSALKPDNGRSSRRTGARGRQSGAPRWPSMKRKLMQSPISARMVPERMEAMFSAELISGEHVHCAGSIVCAEADL